MPGKHERNGRALEFAFVDGFRRHYSDGVVHNLDRLNVLEAKFLQCEPSLQRKFRRAADAYYRWINDEVNFKPGQTNAELRIFTDAEGQEFGVRDISLVIGSLQQDISLKHQHYALKHPRIPSLMQSLGIPKGLTEDTQFRDSYLKKLQSIWAKIEEAGLSLDTFSGLGRLKSEVLYREVTEFICGVLTEHSTNPQRVRSFYSFITGGDHIKLVVEENMIRIFDLRHLGRPKTMKCRTDPERPNYLFIDFDNGLKVFYRVKNDIKKINTDSDQPLKPTVEPVSDLPVLAQIYF